MTPAQDCPCRRSTSWGPLVRAQYRPSPDRYLRGGFARSSGSLPYGSFADGVRSGEDREIHVERIFEAPRETVFAAFTDPGSSCSGGTAGATRASASSWLESR